MPLYLNQVEDCVDRALTVLGNHIVMGAPLGLGKPNQLINAFYRRAAANPHITLEIYTALSLERPRGRSEVENNLLEPIVDRLYGDYPSLAYLEDLRRGSVPDNIRISEFYIKAGSMIGVLPVQSNYISTNYTFVARDIDLRGVNLIVQMVASREVGGQRQFSLSCNTDITLDLHPMMQRRATPENPILSIAQVHDALPFMVNRAIVEEDYFDLVVENADYHTTLFTAPNMAVSDTDYMLGLHASALIKDGGTLQIGIGALGDAITYATQLRHSDNRRYAELIDGAGVDKHLISAVGGTDVFTRGLYGCSEMFVNGFLHLRKAGVLRRCVYDDPDIQRLLNAGQITETVDAHLLSVLLGEGVVGSPLSARDIDWLVKWGVFRADVSYDNGCIVAGEHRLGADVADPVVQAELVQHALGRQLAGGVFMHGGFFIGPEDFYEALRQLPDEELAGIAMDSVRRINRLDNPSLQCLQRRHARFINTGMMVTLGGAVISDGLDNGQVVSGVGGQYNFIAQAHELEDARSIICIRSTRGHGRNTTSNVVASYGHTTIPRHLRDLVVTEYGIADLRGLTDGEVAMAMIAIADSRFQSELLEQAIEAGKVPPDTVVPEEHRQNTPEHIESFISGWRARSCFPPYPLGCDLTGEEQALALSLRELKKLQRDPAALVAATIKSLLHDADDEAAAPLLARIGLSHPESGREKILQQLLLLELEENGYLKPM